MVSLSTRSTHNAKNAVSRAPKEHTRCRRARAEKTKNQIQINKKIKMQCCERCRHGKS